MENKKIKFPIATIFIMIECFIYTLYSLYFCNQSYLGSMALFNYLFPICLHCASKLLFGCLLLRRKADETLFLATCIFTVLSLYFSNQKVLPIEDLQINIIGFIATILTILIVGITTLPKLSEYKNIAKKIFFIPSILFAIKPLSNIPDFLEDGFYFDLGHYSFKYFQYDVIAPMLGTIGVFMFLRWVSTPYKTINITNEYIANNSNETILDYNESYCDLVKHILLSFFTFGIWMFIWIYRTTKTLNKAPNSEKYDQTKQLLLCMFVPFYIIYWFYKHGEKIDKLNAVAGKKAENTIIYLLLGIFVPVVACILMQDNINKLCITNTHIESSINSEISVREPVKDAKNTVEALKEYKSLLDTGIITQEEFDAKKKQLLGL